MLQQAELLAERLKKEANVDEQQQVQLAFALALNRQPSDAEQQAATQLVQEHGLTAFCRALFNANEFLFLP